VVYLYMDRWRLRWSRRKHRQGPAPAPAGESLA
jgi:hypothetical protein